MMARSLGIPARVAVGFLRPERQRRRHLGLQLPRPARLARALLRGHRLGPLRAHPAGPGAGRPGVHRRAACPGPATTRRVDPSASGLDEHPAEPSVTPTGAAGRGDRRRSSGSDVTGCSSPSRPRRAPAAACLPRLCGPGRRRSGSGVGRRRRRRLARSRSPRAPGRRCGPPRSTSVSAGTTAPRCGDGPGCSPRPSPANAAHSRPDSALEDLVLLMERSRYSRDGPHRRAGGGGAGRDRGRPGQPAGQGHAVRTTSGHLAARVALAGPAGCTGPPVRLGVPEGPRAAPARTWTGSPS